jgi:tripartite ATP-independent transporter DctP family solute receptor
MRGGVTRRAFLVRTTALGAALASACKARDHQSRTLTLGYDQPRETAYSFLADTFEKKLAELSAGTLKITQFPGASLGQEPEMAQKVRVGDIDFAFNTTANTATVVPQSAVCAFHYLFRDEAHLERSMGDKVINDTFRQMISENTTGARSLGLMTKGFRNMYAKVPVSSVGDVAGKKVRVQATRTEDAFFRAYGSIPVHMPFGQVYTSLQTGLVQIAENANDSILKNKHYEVAQVVSRTQHEPDNSHIWISQKTWDSLSEEQRSWVQKAADYALPIASRHALELSTAAAAQMQKLGVTLHDTVDRDSFARLAAPLQEGQARELGPYSVRLLDRIRAIA